MRIQGVVCVAEKAVKEIINKLRRKEIQSIDVPEPYNNNLEIVKYERKRGLRRIDRKGFDIISNMFFVEESLIYLDKYKEENTQRITNKFSDFEEYYAFLDGEIYGNACYTFNTIDRALLKSKNIDEEELFSQKAFEEKTIDDYTLESLNESDEEYKEAEKKKRLFKQWINKFNACKNSEDLYKVVNNYEHSKLDVPVSSFLFIYIFENLNDKNRFDSIMKYLSNHGHSSWLYELCTIYEPVEVMNAYDYSNWSQSSVNRHKRKIKDFIQALEEGKVSFDVHASFSKSIHCFIEYTDAYMPGEDYPVSRVRRYFDTFEEFANYRKGNLKNCNLSYVSEPEIDFSVYEVDQTTKLPSSEYSNITTLIEKAYDGYSFKVKKQWKNENGLVLHEIKRYFSYFFDFVAFLKGDLSGADLLMCDGLSNLKRWDGINFTDTKMQSYLCDKFGVSYDCYSLDSRLIKSFEKTEDNENETLSILEQRRELSEDELQAENSVLGTHDNDSLEVFYISDLHLMHRIKEANCRSIEDVEFVIRKAVDAIAAEAGMILLVGGDVSSDFGVFKLFVQFLSQKIDEDTVVIFVLGNHELWSFPGVKLDEIVAEYRTLLEKNGMYLLQNDLLFIETPFWFKRSNAGINMLTSEQISSLSFEELQEALRCARYVFLGGNGFSGFNSEFNADNGIYLGVIDRKTEITESKKFKHIYERLLPVMSSKNTTVLTHTAKSDWSERSAYDKNIVYVNGHTHRNFFYDDGEFRVYSDNQMGYHNKSIHLKSYLVGNNYDYFCDYEDGIYSITPEQYRLFYRGKNIQMTFNNNVNTLYMLKKHGYYCFIHEAENGSLTILNGGAKKRISGTNIQYYYDNMEKVVSELKTPLEKYSAYQKQYSDLVKKIGGLGFIHGCIVDIDFVNHIYINPLDSTVTGYWAADIITKIVYPSIPKLLKQNRPDLYDKYLKLLTEGDKAYLAKGNNLNLVSKAQPYFDTEIYKASRVVKKMQRLDNGILSIWPEQLQDNIRSLNSKKKPRASQDQILDELDNLLEKSNLELLEYSRQADPVEIKCTVCGYSWEEKYWKIKRGSIECPRCNPHLMKEKKPRIKTKRPPTMSPEERLNKRDVQYKKKLAEKSSNSIEVSKYLGSRENIKALCKKCGHVWECRADHLLERCYCPKCKSK